MIFEPYAESLSRRMSADLAKLRRRSEIYDEMAAIVPTGVPKGSFIPLGDVAWAAFEKLADELDSLSWRTDDRPVSEFRGYSWLGSTVIPKRAILAAIESGEAKS